MTGGINPDRRRFLRGRLAPEPMAVRPPWSGENAIAEACPGCGACVSACPQGILGLDRRGHPAIDFGPGECTFCGRCLEACPEPVFDRARPAFPHRAAIGAACLAAKNIVCRSCGDACPETAIRFSLRIGGAALPALDTERCNGCGACQSVCPADAIAMFPQAARDRGGEVRHA